MMYRDCKINVADEIELDTFLAGRIRSKALEQVIDWLDGFSPSNGIDLCFNTSTSEWGQEFIIIHKTELIDVIEPLKGDEGAMRASGSIDMVLSLYPLCKNHRWHISSFLYLDDEADSVAQFNSSHEHDGALFGKEPHRGYDRYTIYDFIRFGKQKTADMFLRAAYSITR